MISTQQFAINQDMSLYIPHVFPNFDEGYIMKMFDGLYGSVQRVDLVAKIDKNGNNYNAVYVHFNEWYNNVIVENFQARITDTEKEARFVHDDPWYWIVLENKSKKHIPGERKQRINITGWEEPSKWAEDMSNCEEHDNLSDGHDDYYTEIAALKERNLKLYNLIDKKDETITILENENEDLLLELQNEHWESINVQYLNYEMEERCSDLELKNGELQDTILTYETRMIHRSHLHDAEIEDLRKTLAFIKKELKNATSLESFRANVEKYIEE